MNADRVQKWKWHNWNGSLKHFWGKIDVSYTSTFDDDAEEDRLREQKEGRYGDWLKEKKKARKMCVDWIRSSQVGQVDRLESFLWPTL